MSYIKTFEKFNSREHYPKRQFDEFTFPEEPFKRSFTKEESMFLHRHFSNHSWSKIDNNGRIILGGGESPAGKYYITESDLEKFMKKGE